MTIGENIKKYRKLKGLKQSELAELSNISRVAIGNYERGERNPNIDTIKQIANALDIPTFLLTGENEVMDLFAGSDGLNNTSTNRLMQGLWKLVNSEKTIDTTPVLHSIEKDKVNLCKIVMHELGYTVDIDKNIVKINDDSHVIKTIKVGLKDYVELSKNVHWALESFVEKFVDEHSMGFICDDEKGEEDNE